MLHSLIHLFMPVIKSASNKVGQFSAVKPCLLWCCVSYAFYPKRTLSRLPVLEMEIISLLRQEIKV